MTGYSKQKQYCAQLKRILGAAQTLTANCFCTQISVAFLEHYYLFIFFSFDLLTVEVNWESCSQNSCFSEKIIKNNCHVALPYYLKQVWLFMSGIRENMYIIGVLFTVLLELLQNTMLSKYFFIQFILCGIWITIPPWLTLFLTLGKSCVNQKSS